VLSTTNKLTWQRGYGKHDGDADCWRLDGDAWSLALAAVR